MTMLSAVSAIEYQKQLMGLQAESFERLLRWRGEMCLVLFGGGMLRPHSLKTRTRGRNQTLLA